MIKEQFELPTYEDAQSRVLEGSGNAIDWFIVENEPGGIVEQAKFRREVTELIEFAMKSAKLACERDWESRFNRENEMHRQETKEFEEMLDRMFGETKNSDQPIVWWLVILLVFFTVAFTITYFRG